MAGKIFKYQLDTAIDPRFGQRLLALRKREGLNQRALAKKCHLTFTYISKLENAATPPPANGTIVILATALNADADELLALAGKVPTDIVEAFQERPALIKEVRGLVMARRLVNARGLGRYR